MTCILVVNERVKMVNEIHVKKWLGTYIFLVNEVVKWLMPRLNFCIGERAKSSSLWIHSTLCSFPFFNYLDIRNGVLLGCSKQLKMLRLLDRIFFFWLFGFKLKFSLLLVWVFRWCFSFCLDDYRLNLNISFIYIKKKNEW